MSHLRFLIISALVLLGTQAMALSIQNIDLISPITERKFPALIVPIAQVAGSSLSDMGYDDDGCRHSNGECEYYYYVVTDPFSYFSALAAEWNEDKGNFEGALPDDMKIWIGNEFKDLPVDQARAYGNAVATAQGLGQPPPTRDQFIMSQASIPLEKRYQFAIQCYEHRGARPVVIAKTALMGVWALRCFCNVLFRNQAIDGGYEEVDDQVKRHVKDGETFQLAKWLPIYKEIFDKGESLTNEGYMVAGLSYFGFALRDGDLKTCQDILFALDKRFKDMDESKTKPLLLGVVLERKRILEKYQQFLTIACDNFIQAVADEEFTRDDLINSKLLVIAESLRRAGRESDAYDWYLALSKCIETQPDLRASMRAQGKSPASDSPQSVQVGWMADQHLAAMVKNGLVHATGISGPQKQLLNAIVIDGLGKSDYVNPNWIPATGMNAEDCRLMMELIGNSVHEYEYRLGNWPAKLDDLWEHQILRDRNRVNRFHDPVKGKLLLYAQPTDTLEQLPPQMVLLSTAEPIPSTQGDVYFAYLVNLKVVASVHPQKPGELFVK